MKAIDAVAAFIAAYAAAKGPLQAFPGEPVFDAFRHMANALEETANRRMDFANPGELSAAIRKAMQDEQ